MSLMSADSKDFLKDVWYIDSGATDHMCGHKNWFDKFEVFQVPKLIEIGNGQTMQATGQGRTNVLAFDGKRWNPKHLAKVIFVPELQYNLFSAGAALDRGMKHLSQPDSCEFTRSGKIEVIGLRRNKLFQALLKVKIPECRSEENPGALASIAGPSDLKIWHERMAHQDKKYVRKFLEQNKIKVNAVENFTYKGCILRKMH